MEKNLRLQVLKLIIKLSFNKQKYYNTFSCRLDKKIYQEKNKKKVPPAGIEPAAQGLGILCSIH